MCGICGYIDFSRSGSDTVLRSMTDALFERGPDQGGYRIIDAGNAQIGLGHRRLSIIDLSDAGCQPMDSATGRMTIILNGEIYNYRALRQALEQEAPIRFKGSSDTEVVVNACERWGVEATLAKLIGMFAFAIWDHQERTFYLARDRMGEKPLYYGWQGKTFLFGSDLKALEQHPAMRKEINLETIQPFLERSYIPAPLSIYNGIFKLLPGYFLKMDLAQLQPAQPLTPSPYWDITKVCKQAIESRRNISYQDALSELERLLLDSVSGQMVSDVPLGAFLSGGIDSSLVVATMQRISSRPVKTFTIGFTNPDYDEAPYARRIAQHLKTDHHELYIGPEDITGLIPQLPNIYSEPFADSSQLPTILVSRVARQHVTVSLSGDAGDELFLGYDRYAQIARRMALIGSSPAKELLRLLPPQMSLSTIRHVAKLNGRFATWGHKAERLLSVARCRSRSDFYNRSISRFANADLFLETESKPSYSDSVYALPDIPDSIELFSMLDMIGYLPDDILAKVDRAAMHQSLETRVPLLDHRIVEFALSLPRQIRCRNGAPKSMLKDLLEKSVPLAMFNRPKRGFAAPVQHWILNELKDWAQDLISEQALRNSPVPWNVKNVMYLFGQHYKGHVEHNHNLWNILMLQAWTNRS